MSRFSRKKTTKDVAEVKKDKVGRVKVDTIVSGPDAELFINQQELNRELLDQPLRFRKWTKLKSEVQKNLSTLELRLKALKAETRLKLAKEGLRVKELDSMVDADADVLQLANKVIDTQELLDEYEGIVRSFYQRHEVLKDLCANARKELID